MRRLFLRSLLLSHERQKILQRQPERIRLLTGQCQSVRCRTSTAARLRGSAPTKRRLHLGIARAFGGMLSRICSAEAFMIIRRPF